MKNIEALVASKLENLPIEVVMALGARNSELTYFNNVVEWIAKSYLKDYLHELTSCGE